MDDRFGVDVIKVCHDPGFEFGLGSDPDVTQHRPRHLGKEPLHEIEPGTVLWREHERKAAFGLGVQPRPGFLRNVR